MEKRGYICPKCSNTEYEMRKTAIKSKKDMSPQEKMMQSRRLDGNLGLALICTKCGHKHFIKLDDAKYY